MKGGQPRTEEYCERRDIDLERMEAFIFDMDGVVTDTARLHAAAWKRTFDDYLGRRAAHQGEAFRPFDIDADYPTYVDGKPRSEGARDFLASRRIILPYGEPSDPPDTETVWGISNRKDRHFNKLLEDQGAEPRASTLEFIDRLREKGVRYALISASRNTRKVLRVSRLDPVFEVVVDGIDARELGLRGKPAPDIFLEAARRLSVRPEKAAIVEDSIAGVEAGRAGGFAAVIGVDNGGQEAELRKHGADMVVSDLSRCLGGAAEGIERDTRPPSATDQMEEIFKRLRKGVPAVLLDYDGTLTPIVREPSLAVLSGEMREVLYRLAKVCLVAVVSGRDLRNVRQMVGLDNLAYIGSHGFEMALPDGTVHVQERGGYFLPALDAAEADLRTAIEGAKGAWVERKRFAIALHYREVAAGDVPELARRLDAVAVRYPDLRRTGGKKVFELRPNLEWGKGKAVHALLEMLHVDASRVVPLFIGDDVTDEDAFRAIGDSGVTILVSDRDQATAARFVLNDVPEVRSFLEGLADRFESEAGRSSWVLRYDGFEPGEEKLRETLCTTGNGYLASRGAAPESSAGKIHYPGNYLAGVYNRRRSSVLGQAIENESMVNIPNWTQLVLSIEGTTVDADAAGKGDYRQELDMGKGVMRRIIILTDRQGRRTHVRQRKFVSMAAPHLAGLETTITPENWSGTVHVLSGIDGAVDNTLVDRYLPLDNHHLEPVGTGVSGSDTIWLQAETNQSHVRIAEAARTRVFRGLEEIKPPVTVRERPGHIAMEMDVPVTAGRPTRIEKIAAIYSSKDRAVSESLFEAIHELGASDGFEALLTSHANAWDRLWDRCHITVDADHEQTEKVLNLHIFHLLQTVSPHSIDLDIGVPPRGLHGEAYRGLIMWDEIFIFPFLNYRVPDLTRSLLLYRFRRLPWARWAAGREGRRGAMFPWQSGSDGREEAQVLHLNPLTLQWIPDHSHLERHIGLAVGYNIWQYYQVTGDREFMMSYGIIMMVEIARFWASKVVYSESRDRYEILGVMGPDEFHEKYPDAREPGIDNNAYTNVMAAWLFCRTLDALQVLPPDDRRDLMADLSVSDEELARWDRISRRMLVPFHDGVISQFEGYADLAELDWNQYRSRYGNIHRLDRILKAEGSSPDQYKVSKQADALMLFYLLSADELKDLFGRLGYRWEKETMTRTIDYYMGRTSHGSTLSRVVHAWVLSRINRERSWSLFQEALLSDVSDIQGGTTMEGIHLGAMAGTVDIVQRCYSGLEARGDVLWFNPSLPKGLRRLRFDIVYRRHRIDVDIGRDALRLTSRPENAGPISIGFDGAVRPLAPGTVVEMALR